MRFPSSSADCWFPRPGSVSPSSFAFIMAASTFCVERFHHALVARIRGLPSKNA